MYPSNASVQRVVHAGQISISWSLCGLVIWVSLCEVHILCLNALHSMFSAVSFEWCSITAGKYVFGRKSLIHGCWGSSTFELNCTKCAL